LHPGRSEVEFADLAKFDSYSWNALSHLFSAFEKKSFDHVLNDALTGMPNSAVVQMDMLNGWDQGIHETTRSTLRARIENELVGRSVPDDVVQQARQQIIRAVRMIEVRGRFGWVGGLRTILARQINPAQEAALNKAYDGIVAGYRRGVEELGVRIGQLVSKPQYTPAELADILIYLSLKSRTAGLSALGLICDGISHRFLREHLAMISTEEDPKAVLQSMILHV